METGQPELSPADKETFEMFLGEKMRDVVHVVYVLYDKNGVPLYVGYSSNFYKSYTQKNTQQPFFPFIHTIGFYFFSEKTEMIETKPLIMHAKQPRFCPRKKPLPANLDIFEKKYQELVVTKSDLEKLWKQYRIRKNNQKGDV